MPARKPIEHGTYKGYQQHRRAHEDACGACKAANTTYHRDWRGGQSEEDRKLVGARKAARLRALEGLARRYPHEYAELLSKELVAVGSLVLEVG